MASNETKSIMRGDQVIFGKGDSVLSESIHLIRLLKCRNNSSPILLVNATDWIPNKIHEYWYLNVRNAGTFSVLREKNWFTYLCFIPVIGHYFNASTVHSSFPWFIRSFLCNVWSNNMVSGWIITCIQINNWLSFASVHVKFDKLIYHYHTICVKHFYTTTV